MIDFDVCENCGGQLTRSSPYGPPPRKWPSGDSFRNAIVMGYVREPLRCIHCEWDDRLLPGTPAEAGLHSLHRLYLKGLIDREEFLARERVMLLELLGIDSLEAVPEAVTKEVIDHIESLRAGEPDTRGAAGALPDFGYVNSVITPQQVIAGYDPNTGLVAFAVDLRRVIDLFGADAPGPFTAMWIRVTKLDEATTHEPSLAEMLRNLTKDWLSDRNLDVERTDNDD